MLITLAVVGILGLSVVRPVNGLIRRIRMQNAVKGISHFILNARAHAMANPMVHCAVVFSPKPGSSPDSVWSFLDKSKPANGVFNSAIDQIYQQPFVLKAKDSIQIMSAIPDTVVFRGDGSANTSVKVVVRLFNIVDTVDILASTGRVKVIPR